MKMFENEQKFNEIEIFEIERKRSMNKKIEIDNALLYFSKSIMQQLERLYKQHLRDNFEIN